MKFFYLTFLLAFLSLASFSQQMIKPGEVWPDSEGKHINAHGGGIISYGKTWYWFGESRLPRGESDRWTPQNLADSRHIWLPIEWENGKPVIKWYKEWDIKKTKDKR